MVMVTSNTGTRVLCYSQARNRMKGSLASLLALVGPVYRTKRHKSSCLDDDDARHKHGWIAIEEPAAANSSPGCQVIRHGAIENLKSESGHRNSAKELGGTTRVQ